MAATSCSDAIAIVGSTFGTTTDVGQGRTCPTFPTNGIGFFQKETTLQDAGWHTWNFSCLFNSPKIYVFAAPNNADCTVSQRICLLETNYCPPGGDSFKILAPSTAVLQTYPGFESVTSFTYYVWYFWPSNA